MKGSPYLSSAGAYAPVSTLVSELTRSQVDKQPTQVQGAWSLLFTLTDPSGLIHPMPIPFYSPSPAPPATFRNAPLPWMSANLLSKVFSHWITPVLKVGYSRPLEPDGT